MLRFFEFFYQTLGIWIQGSGAARHVSSVTYFSNLLEDKDKRFKTNLTLSLILQFNLRLGGYSIWSAIFIASHIKEDLKLLKVWAPHSLEATKKVLWARLQDRIKKKPKWLQKYSEVLRSMQYWLRRARGLVRSGATELHTWYRIF
jgi:hypothetical protein